MENRIPLRVLLIGKGGRESALAVKLSQSPRVEKIFVVPGNGGTARGIDKVSNLEHVSEKDFDGLVELAKELRINLVIPETAQLEGSKAFSKDFMAAHKIPTAEYQKFRSFPAAVAYLNSISHRVVLKASGLAAGKGVILPETKKEALQALREIMLEHKFGDAGDEVVIEEFLEGDELSILTFSDGVTFKSMPPAQDHKRIFDGDLGPNTGGMGCYAPTKIATPDVIRDIEETILRPTFEGLWKKSDLAEIMVACIEGRLHEMKVEMHDRFCVVVIISAKGYPGAYPEGDIIKIGSFESNTRPSSSINFFHAGTKLMQNGSIVTAGGRVMAISTTEETLESAVKLAYKGVEAVHFDGMFYRKDIAYRKRQKRREKDLGQQLERSDNFP
ncbi:phosphoribosylamine--glycine ligase [Stipitochalara longipes BDJ]|nr:phosphoribosylamine--glycine ligase [Stipitochalara longipes BDJ]